MSDLQERMRATLARVNEQEAAEARGDVGHRVVGRQRTVRPPARVRIIEADLFSLDRNAYHKWRYLHRQVIVDLARSAGSTCQCCQSTERRLILERTEDLSEPSDPLPRGMVCRVCRDLLVGYPSVLALKSRMDEVDQWAERLSTPVAFREAGLERKACVEAIRYLATRKVSQ